MIHYYEAVLLYAEVVKAMDAAGTNYSSGRNFTATVGNNFSFVSPITGDVSYVKAVTITGYLAIKKLG